MDVGDDATRDTPVDGQLPTTELDPATTLDGPLAYSEPTNSMPVIEYRPPRLQPVWIITLALTAATAVAVAMFLLGRTTAPQQPPPPAPVQTSTAAQAPVAPPPVAAPPPTRVAPPEVAAPPPIAVVPPTQPAPTTSTPPLATPQARIAEPMICALHNQYPQMQPVDLTLTLMDRGIYNDYDEAALVVDLVLKDGCHGI